MLANTSQWGVLLGSWLRLWGGRALEVKGQASLPAPHAWDSQGVAEMRCQLPLHLFPPGPVVEFATVLRRGHVAFVPVSVEYDLSRHQHCLRLFLATLLSFPNRAANLNIDKHLHLQMLSYYVLSKWGGKPSQPSEVPWRKIGQTSN